MCRPSRLGRAATRRLAQALSGEPPDAFEKRDVEFHERLREGYLEIANAEPVRCRVIDGTGDPDALRRRCGHRWSAACWRGRADGARPGGPGDRGAARGRSPRRFPHPRETHGCSATGGRSRAGAGVRGRAHASRLAMAGREGIGKATLAYRLARHVLARPEERDPLGQSLDVAADGPPRQVRRCRIRDCWCCAGSTTRTSVSGELPVDEVRRLNRFLG